MDKDIGKGWRLKEINIPAFAPAGKSFEAVTELYCFGVNWTISLYG